MDSLYVEPVVLNRSPSSFSRGYINGINNNAINTTITSPPLQHRRHASMGHSSLPSINPYHRHVGDTVYGMLDPFSAYQRYYQQQQQTSLSQNGQYAWHSNQNGTRYQSATVVTTVGHTSVSTVMPTIATIMNGLAIDRESDAISQTASDHLAVNFTNGHLEISPLDNDSAGSDSSTGLPPNPDLPYIGAPPPLPFLEGRLNKWTNLLHGWQERYFVLADGTLSYYRCKEEQNLGCRGSLRLAQAIVRPHEYDDCRFEVRLGDNIWYLRGSNLSERHTWIQGLECHRIADAEASCFNTIQAVPVSGVSTINGHPPVNASAFIPASHLSLPSTASHSLASASSFQRGHRLREKLAEMETFKEILCKQVDTLQVYFDSCSHLVRQTMQSMLYEDSNASSTAMGLPHLPELQEELWDRFQGEYRRESVDDFVKPLRNGTLAEEVEDCDHCSSVTGMELYCDALNTMGNSDDDNDELVSATSGLTPTTSPAASVCNAKSSNVSPQHQQQQPPTRGFLSRFFTFRNNTGCNANGPNQSITDSTLDSNITMNGNSSVDYNELQKLLSRHGAQAPDFRGEAITFKATTAGILSTLSHCIDLMLQSEEQWHRRLEMEREKRRRQEETYRTRLCNLMEELRHERELNAALQSKPSHGTISETTLFIGSPDIEEGPNCSIDETTMKEALEMQMEQLAKQEDLRAAIRVANESLSVASKMSPDHALYADITRVVNDHLVLCDPTAVNLTIENGWQEIARDGEMRFYKREITSSDGKVLDPLQALHTINGITAHELCEYFWNVKYRLEWEFTIDQPPKILEVCGEDTVVLHQVYKRVWPASQRDGVFWSHIRRVSQEELRKYCSSTTHPSNCDTSTTSKTYPLPNGEEDFWMVLNYSTDYLAPDLSNMPNQMIRLAVDVVLIAQTLRRDPNLPCTRDNICCRMLYAASIDPGGWVPAAMLRKLTQREYPRFVKQFSQYVIEKTTSEPLYW